MTFTTQSDHPQMADQLQPIRPVREQNHQSEGSGNKCNRKDQNSLFLVAYPSSSPGHSLLARYDAAQKRLVFGPYIGVLV
ncbi:hypothetical protein MXD81_21255, partial [Microbacteriaceae bacterium K1510]|nr:hypothetical protein [Microbacteriaceae bacterium K1510]